MTSPFLLDTNSYFLLFQTPKPHPYLRLIQKIKDGDEISFYISEITAMEIHSVLGKYRRGAPRQQQPCDREFIDNTKVSKCSRVWVFTGRRQMPSKMFRDLQKMIFDIERGRGDIVASKLNLDSNSISVARHLLTKYADRYSIGSHDALIAGTVVAANRFLAMNLSLVTSDKGLKAVLRDETIPFYDPAEI